MQATESSTKIHLNNAVVVQKTLRNSLMSLLSLSPVCNAYMYLCYAADMAAAASMPGTFCLPQQQFEQQRDLTPCQEYWHDPGQPRASKRAAVDANAVGDGERGCLQKKLLWCFLLGRGLVVQVPGRSSSSTRFKPRARLVTETGVIVRRERTAQSTNAKHSYTLM